MGCMLQSSPAINPRVSQDYNDITDGKNTLSTRQVESKMIESGFSKTFIKQFIRLLDKNGDGFVSEREFDECYGFWTLIQIYNKIKKASNSAEVTVEQFKVGLKQYDEEFDDTFIDMVIRKIDVDGNGAITFNEITRAYRISQDWKVFNEMDTDRSGTIDIREAVKYFKQRCFPTLAIEMAVEQTDVNYSGDLDFDEFHHAFMHTLCIEREQMLNSSAHTGLVFLI
eukprot:181347_1